MSHLITTNYNYDPTKKVHVQRQEYLKDVLKLHRDVKQCFEGEKP